MVVARVADRGACWRIGGALFMAGWLVPASAQGVTDLLRGISGALRGQQQPQQQQGLTPTIGVRGIEEGGAATGAAATGDYALVESWMVSEAQALADAGKRKLRPRVVSLRSGAPASTPAPQDSAAPEGRQ